MTPADRELADLLRGGVLLWDGEDRPPRPARIELDADGGVAAIEPALGGGLLLAPSFVDLHCNVVERRRRPRPGVEAPLPLVVRSLDAELAAAGVGLVCVTARFEHLPECGVDVAAALELCAAIDELAPLLSCDWRVHARVEVTDPDGSDALGEALDSTARIALVSPVDHSPERSRFASLAEQRRFYARDWGVAPELVEEVLARRRRGAGAAAAQRSAVAALARGRELALASHDDRSPADVEAAFALGARICGFPLALGAALTARSLGMRVVLGAANALFDRSTSPGNLTVVDAVAAGACDALCSDYLPAAILHAPLVLHARGVVSLERALSMVTSAPRRMLGDPPAPVASGRRLDATLIDPTAEGPVAVAVWRDGRLVHRSATNSHLDI